MSEYMNDNRVHRCPNCGAVAVSEICQYCGALTGLSTDDSDMMYPSMKVKAAHFTFWNSIFPCIFAVSFGFFGFIFPMIFSSFGDEFTMVKLICIPFKLISLGALYIILRTAYYNILLSFKGEEIEGTVYGYMDDNVMYNGVPGQKMKILIRSNGGYKFLLYSLHSTDRPYPVNKKITLRVYKDMCKIYEEKKNCLD